MTALWVTTIVVGVLSVPFVIVWWRIGDRWADSENKRFKPKAEADNPADHAITIEDPARHQPAQEPESDRP